MKGVVYIAGGIENVSCQYCEVSAARILTLEVNFEIVHYLPSKFIYL
jgi:hypothetical protein